MKYFTLKNGLSVLFCQMPNTHSVTVGLYIKAGSAYEKADSNGITHLLEHMHFRKIGKYSQEKLYYKMESIGSTLRATTYRDFLKFSMKAVPEKLSECIDIFCELILEKDWMNSEVEKEKEIVINQILEKGNYITLEKEVRKNVFKEHPLANDIMGTIQSVRQLEGSDLQKYKNSIFTEGNMLVCITGNFTNGDMNIVNEKLEVLKISNVKSQRKLKTPKCFQKRKPDIHLKDVGDDNLLEVSLSFEIEYDETTKATLTILNCIVGEGVGSRLQKRIREERVYSSDIASFMEWYSGFAIMHICFSVERSMLEQCVREIIEILKDVKHNINYYDLDVSLPFYIQNQVFYEDDTEEMNFQLAYNKFILGMKNHNIYLENNCDAIERLQDMAKRLFVKRNLAITVVGNMRKIHPELFEEIAGTL